MIVVKVCGITNLKDAQVVLGAGADLLGFNFFRPSSRYVEPEIAARIIRALRADFQHTFLAVGVFVNAPLSQIEEIESECGLDLLQLHGDETFEFCQAAGPRAFKALRPASAAEARASLEQFAARGGEVCQAPRFLIDASHPSLYGGTGATGDWLLAAEIAACYAILLAGGLNPQNVGAAIRAVRPWGVDVASGVERAPGLKDADKLRAFVIAAKDA